MRHATRRGVRRLARRNAPDYSGSHRTLSAFAALLEKAGKPSRVMTRASSTQGQKVIAFRVALPRSDQFGFHHPTKKATRGRYCVVEVPR